MAAIQHIFLLLTVCVACLCHVLASDRREEWIAALSRLPELALDDDVADDAETDVLDEMPSVFFSYGSSYAVETLSSQQQGDGDEPTVNNGTAELRMPNVHPKKANDYFCHWERMPMNKGVYIVGFTPVTTEGTAHHILIYGCKKPGSYSKNSWNCGEMDMAKDSEQGSTAPPCEDEPKILYAWAMDAPALELPKDIGFEVGHKTGIDYLVLQVHYMSVERFKDGSTDNSGVALSWTLTPQPFRAGIYFMGSDGAIPARSKDVHLESACMYTGPERMHPFAYRVHTHKLGQVVAGYRIRDNQWTLIGKRSPQLPQMFNPIKRDVTVMPGDKLAVRCTFASDRNEITYIGPTGEDEMCNFYIMYYTTDGRLPQDDTCYGREEANLQFARDASSPDSTVRENSM